jgi:hypothetical protein
MWIKCQADPFIRIRKHDIHVAADFAVGVQPHRAVEGRPQNCERLLVPGEAGNFGDVYDKASLRTPGPHFRTQPKVDEGDVEIVVFADVLVPPGEEPFLVGVCAGEEAVADWNGVSLPPAHSGVFRVEYFMPKV